MTKEHGTQRPISRSEAALGRVDEVLFERSAKLLSHENFGPVEFKKILENILRMGMNQNLSEQTIDLLGHPARFVEDEVFGKAYGIYRIGSQMAVDIVPLEVLKKVNEVQNSADVGSQLLLEKVRTTLKLFFSPAVVAEYICLRSDVHAVTRPFATDDPIAVRAKKGFLEQRTLTDKQQKRLALNIFSAWHVASHQI